MKRKFEDGALIEHCDGPGEYRKTRFDGRVCDLYGCRVLVSKERLEQKWPTEKDGPEGEAFRKFAARLADAVQKALAEGKTIGTALGEGSDCCPLGCLEEARGCPFPGSAVAPLGQVDEWFDFFCAFDGKSSRCDSHYYRLGLEYRKRFVTKETE